MTRAVKTLSIVLAATATAVAVVHTFAAQPDTRPRLQLEDYAQLPITASSTARTREAQLARVNFMRDEPGGRRFFVNDFNGPLYILDKQTKKFTTYLDFNGARRTAGAVSEVHVRAQLRHRPDQLRVRSRLRAQRRLLHAAHGGSDRSPAPRRAEARRRPGLDCPATRRRRRFRRRRSTARSTRGRADRVDGSQHPPTRRSRARRANCCACSIRRRIHPLGEMTFNPVARRGDAGLAGDVPRRRRLRHPASSATAAA